MTRMPIRRLAVFCASRPGTDDRLLRTAYDTGKWLASRDIGVVYGGGGSGLMGALADGALSCGGEVIGVIPDAMMDREWGRSDLTALHVVGTMHERKAMMSDLADAFLALPGGVGTLEEFFEVWTWRTLGYHSKPVGLLDVDGFWGPLLQALKEMRELGFVSDDVLDDLVVEPTVGAAVQALKCRLEH